MGLEEGELGVGGGWFGSRGSRWRWLWLRCRSAGRLWGCGRFDEGFDGALLVGLLEVLEDGFGAGDDGSGEAGEASDVNAVGAVGTTSDDFVHEDDGVLVLADGNIVIDDARELVLKLNELVIVSSEEGFRFCSRAVVEVLDN